MPVASTLDAGLPSRPSLVPTSSKPDDSLSPTQVASTTCRGIVLFELSVQGVATLVERIQSGVPGPVAPPARGTVGGHLS